MPEDRMNTKYPLVENAITHRVYKYTYNDVYTKFKICLMSIDFIQYVKLLVKIERKSIRYEE